MRKSFMSIWKCVTSVVLIVLFLPHGVSAQEKPTQYVQEKGLQKITLFPEASNVGPSDNGPKGRSEKKKHFIKEVYFSWGYNTEWYTRSNVHISQPSLGNDYTFKSIKGHDHRGWDEGLFQKALTIPQYNYRLGFVLNEEKGLAFEINFDHTKFIFADQDARIKGTLNHRQVDTTVAFNEANGFYYYLNNGANFLLFNIVKRWHIMPLTTKKVQLDVLAKGGIGPVIPHVDNSLFGDHNDAHFQFGGWNIGVEGCIRATFFNYVYLEYSNKLDYARYSGLEVYQGKARQAFGCYEMILSLGVRIPTGGR